MPEIMSAKQASGTIDDIFCECTGYNGRCAFVEVQTFISSRDSAIIEKCKEAIRNSKGVVTFDMDCASPCRVDMPEWAKSMACDILDSVLSDINGAGK
jgi:hypothetical protein